MSRKSIYIFIIITVLFVMPITAIAHTIPVTGDDTAGWIMTAFHYGSKSTTYDFDLGCSGYETMFNSGKSKWGSYINLSKDTSSPDGCIQDTTMDPIYNWIAQTYQSISVWSITANTTNYDPLSKKELVWAHEIGHVYGLGHVNTGNTYMMYPYYNTSLYIHTDEKEGMDVATATHVNHNTNTATIYDSNYHKVRCTICYGHYGLEGHTYDGNECIYCGYIQ